MYLFTYLRPYSVARRSVYTYNDNDDDDDDEETCLTDRIMKLPSVPHLLISDFIILAIKLLN